MMTLTVVGLGPGDPELLTLKGLRAIEAADLIFVPNSREDGDSRALHIAERWLNRERQQVVHLSVPMTRDSEQIRLTWHAMADQIGSSLMTLVAEREQDDVHGVYLLLGDPLLYGTFVYFWDELTERYPNIVLDIIPGVTSFAAVAARAGMELSTRSDRVAIVPALYTMDMDYLRHLCASFETVILMKVGKVLPRVLAELEHLGLLEKAVYAEHIGMDEERIVRDVRTLKRQQGPYLSLLIIRQRGDDVLPEGSQ
ncbi:MAG: precorrin-2 C(20)-methyltransferase [Chloroflexaceae bacterium]|nr:precorrin-2 C(20)-methyltransferase [Chloroflexaceae bacterium]